MLNCRGASNISASNIEIKIVVLRRGNVDHDLDVCGPEPLLEAFREADVLRPRPAADVYYHAH